MEKKLSQSDINELYSMADKHARMIIDKCKINSKEQLKKQIYYQMKYFYVNRHGNIRGISHPYKRHKFYDLFKNHNYFGCSFGSILDERATMLEKIMNKVVEDCSIQEDTLWCELRTSINDMNSCVDKMKQVNEQGILIAEDLAKVPSFLETGKWE